MRRTAASSVFALTLGLAALGAQRLQPRLLPAFEVIAADERTLNSQQIAMEGTWILLYLQQDCRLCDLILKVADSEEHPRLGERLIIIEGGVTARQLTTIAGPFSRVPQTAWHADPRLEAFERLQVPGVPAVMGMRGRSIEWTLSGVLLNSGTLESLFASWVRQ